MAVNLSPEELAALREVVQVLLPFRHEPKTSEHNRRRLIDGKGMRDDNVLALVAFYKISPRTASFLIRKAWDAALSSASEDADLVAAIEHARSELDPSKPPPTAQSA